MDSRTGSHTDSDGPRSTCISLYCQRITTSITTDEWSGSPQNRSTRRPGTCSRCIRFANGCIADLSANRVCPTAIRSMQVWSAGGCVSADLHNRTVSSFGPAPALRSGQLTYDLGRQKGADINQLKAEMFTRFVASETITVEPADALTLELRSFLDAVRNGTHPEVDGMAGLRAIELADAILKSVATHRWEGLPTGLTGPNVLLDRLTSQSEAA